MVLLNGVSKTYLSLIYLLLNQKIMFIFFHREGFTVLLYGLGSKRHLINNFYKKMIPDEPALVINGFFPSLTIKEVIFQRLYFFKYIIIVFFFY